MPDLTRSEVQALLDGATPGPWEPDVELRMVVAPSPSGECFGYVAKDVAALGDVALLAAAPQIAKQLLDALDELDHYRAVRDDVLWLVRLARGCSWPADMAERVERAAERVLAALTPKDGTDGQ